MLKLSKTAQKIYHEICAEEYDPCCGELDVENYSNEADPNEIANCWGCYFYDEKRNACICKEFLQRLTAMEEVRVD